MGRSSWFEAGGRGRVRVRETHVRDHLAPLLSRGADGVVKLDFALRGLAVLSGGASEPGEVPTNVSWEQLHDLVRNPYGYRPEDGTLKRKWIGDKLDTLETMGLLTRHRLAGRRSRLIVLRDTGDHQPFDDPTGEEGDSYVTILGTLLQFGRLADWRSPQLVAYIAAMVAERYARSDKMFAKAVDMDSRPLGEGLWYRPYGWFADKEGVRPDNHVRIPFSERTLRRGLRELQREKLVGISKIRGDPRTGKPLTGQWPRALYHNHFADLRR